MKKEELLTTLRDPLTSPKDFRTTSQQLAHILAQEEIPHLSQRKVLLVPILRSGLALLPAFSDAFPTAHIGILGIQRDPKTALPRKYYEHIPQIPYDTHVLILDPMIATGGTARMAINILIERGAEPTNITLIGVIASQEGIDSIAELYPNLSVKVIATDPSLSPDMMIVPGLGDFGDRYFGTM